jgi:hypothetical protein
MATEGALSEMTVHAARVLLISSMIVIIKCDLLVTVWQCRLPEPVRDLFEHV